jgi:hypothetical protein
VAQHSRSALATADRHIDSLALSTVLDESIDIAIDAKENRVVDFLAWAKKVPEPKSGTLDFTRFPFQVELYKKLAHDRDGVVMKGTQVGVSAWLLRWAIFWADTRGLTALYVFPKDKQLGDFSNQRIRPLITGSSYLADRVPGDHINNVHLRQIGLGWINLRGSQSKEALDSVDADVLALDEYDTLTQENIPDAERRVSAPTSKGLIRRVGVPSVDDFGISKLYEKSDRRRWFVRCGHCNERQFIHFFQRDPNGEVVDETDEDAQDDGLPNATSAYVNREVAAVYCGKCHSEIGADEIQHGEWVAEFPMREVKGYHIHRMMVPGSDVKKIVESSEAISPMERQVFWNKDLGLPHSEKEGRLSKQAISAAQAVLNYNMGPRSGYSGSNLITMGVDVASVRDLNIRVSEHLGDRRKRALFIGTAKNFDVVAELIDAYRVNMTCIDHLPDGRLAREIANRYHGRVFISRFLPPTSHDVLVWDDEQMTAGIKRTEAIDATYSLVRAQRNLLPLDVPEDYVTQLRAAQRFDSIDDMGRRTVGYKKLGDQDYLMAEVYDLMASELWSAINLTDALKTEEVTTLDEQLEGFQRSTVDDPNTDDFSLGPDESGYGEEPPEW